MIDMVVFDMAGTTVNEGNIVYKTLHQSINAWGFDFSLEQVLSEGAGKEKLQAIKDILKINGRSSDDILAARIHSEFVFNLERAYREASVQPQPHAEEIFNVLKNRNIYIVLNTGYDSATARFLVTKLGWDKKRCYDLLVTAGEVKKSRPAPDMILLAMDHFKISSPDQVIKVGDSVVDIEEGKNAGCYTVGITSGAQNRDQLRSAGPDFIIDDLIELLPLIDSYSSR